MDWHKRQFPAMCEQNTSKHTNSVYELSENKYITCIL